mgnify:CR=1 FL=1
MGGRTDGRTDGQTDGRMAGRTDGRTGGRTDGRTDGRADGPAGERTDKFFPETLSVPTDLCLVETARTCSTTWGAK